MLSRLKFELTDLANEILDQFPKSVFESSTTTFCDPCIGGGQMIAAVESRLRAYGHSDANIASRVFGFEENPMRLRFAKRKFNLAAQLNIYKLDESEINMKFNVTLANPPYQSNSNGRAEKLWPKFVATAFDITQDDGIVALITPTGWTSGSKNIVKGSVGMLHDYLHKYNVTHVDLDVREHFPGIGSTIGYTITEKKPNEGNTKINGRVIDLSQFDILPAVKKDFDVASSLLEKIFSFESFSLFSSTGGGSNRKLGEDAPTADKTIETFVRGGNLDTVYYAYFSTTENAKLAPFRKVLIPISGAEKFMPFIDDLGIPYSISCYGVTLNDTETAEGAISVFYSKLFRHLMQHYRTSGFIQIQIAKNLPKVDMSKVWTDDELYAHFGLTQEEIEYVEANV